MLIHPQTRAAGLIVSACLGLILLWSAGHGLTQIRLKRRIQQVKSRCGPSRVTEFEQVYGRYNLRLSRGYEGSLFRLEQFVSKVIRGTPVTIAVLGGSVTRGHQVWPDEIWFSRFVQWMQTWGGGVEIIAVNGATPATGSDYYSYCLPLHIPANADLVLIELGINDSAFEGHVRDMENLLRGLLAMDGHPAVILVEALAFANGGMGGGGGRMHLPVAQYYDVPVVNQRHPTTNHFARYPELTKAYFSQNFWGEPDTWHLNSRGHWDLGMLVASLVEDAACGLLHHGSSLRPAEQPTYHAADPLSLSHKSWPLATQQWEATVSDNITILPGRFNTPVELDQLPRLGVLEGWNPDISLSQVPFRPTCLSEQAPTLELGLNPASTSGWKHWHDPSGQTKPYFTATEPGATVTFDIAVGQGGRVELYSMRSRDLGLGIARCWVDSAEERAVEVSGYWESDATIGRLAIIGEGITPGVHSVTCTLLKETFDPGGGTEFRMIALVA